VHYLWSNSALQKRKKKSVDDNDTTHSEDGYDPHTTDPDDCTAAPFAGNGLNTDANAIWTPVVSRVVGE